MLVNKNEEIEAVREKVIVSAIDMLREPVEVIDLFFEDAPHGTKPLWLNNQPQMVHRSTYMGKGCIRI